MIVIGLSSYSPILVHLLLINGALRWISWIQGIRAIEGGLVSGSRPKIWWPPWSNEHFDDHDAFRYITSMYPGDPYFCCSTQFGNFQCWKMQLHTASTKAKLLLFIGGEGTASVNL